MDEKRNKFDIVIYQRMYEEGRKANEMPNGIDEELIEYGWEEDIWYVCGVETLFFCASCFL